MIVVADTSPINYLLQIDSLETTVPRLYEHVILPGAVLKELLDPGAPRVVRTWAASPPEWVRIDSLVGPELPELDKLDVGERSAICAAVAQHISAVLLDDLRARILAENLFQLKVTGTLGILRDAHLAGFLSAELAYRALRSATNFYCSQDVEERFLASLNH